MSRKREGNVGRIPYDVCFRVYLGERVMETPLLVQGKAVHLFESGIP